jgi:hypothetical protein
MFSSLPEKYGVHPVIRQWIPKAKSKTDGAAPPRPGKLLDKVTGIVIGDTGWPGLTAADAAKDLGQAFGHFLIDDNAIIECVPALTSSVGIVEQARFVETRTPAGAVDAHETTLAINLCFGGPAGGKVAFNHCVALVACLCDRFKLDPAKDVKRAGELDPARRDPDQALRAAESDFDKLKAAVAKLYEETKPQPAKPTAVPEAAHA